MLVAFFAAMSYAALRPEEAAMLRKSDLQLPEEGWGELLLSETAPITGAAWTDSGERRQLKQRGKGEVRAVAVAVAAAVDGDSAHAPDHARHSGRWAAVPEPDRGRPRRIHDRPSVGQGAQGRASEDEYASPPAKRPHDLRHACVSTCFAAGAPSTQWAGHSVAVLHQIYAKVIAGLESGSPRPHRESSWLGELTAGSWGAHGGRRRRPDTAGHDRTHENGP